MGPQKWSELGAGENGDFLMIRSILLMMKVIIIPDLGGGESYSFNYCDNVY